MGRKNTAKNIGNALFVKLVGAIAVAGIVYFVLYPTAIHSINSVGAGAIFKQTPECKEWSEKFIDAMKHKQDTTSIIDDAKQAGCKK